RAAGGDPPPRPRLGAAAGDRAGGDPGPPAALPSLQRPPRPPPLCRGVQCGGGRARALARGRGGGPSPVPAQLRGAWAAGAAARAGGTAPEPGIRLPAPLRHRAPPGAEPRAGAPRRAGAGRAPPRLRRGAAAGAPSGRYDRCARDRAARRADRLIAFAPREWRARGAPALVAT